jgi:hypothetical protein
VRTRTEYVVGLGMDTQNSIVMGRCRSRKRGPPGRSSEQAKVFPTKLEGAIVLDQGVAVRREHAEEQGSLGCGISSQRDALEPTLLQLLPPVVELHLPAPRRPPHRQHVADLSR